MPPRMHRNLSRKRQCRMIFIFRYVVRYLEHENKGLYGMLRTDEQRFITEAGIDIDLGWAAPRYCRTNDLFAGSEELFTDMLFCAH